MTSGGARKRSGPLPDPNSARSEAKTNHLPTATSLPSEGFQGPIPDFPIPDPTEREIELWEWLWRTPQAAMWASEPWRVLGVAQYARQAVRAEILESPGVVTAMLRLADQIGLTPDGMRAYGWAVATVQVGPRVTDGVVKPRRLRATA